MGNTLKDYAKLVIKGMPLDSLKPHPQNPRIHPDPGSFEWESLRKSLENVYFDPLVWNKRNEMLVSGHLRKKVFQSMGIVKADCVIIDVDEKTHIALLMRANNQSGEFESSAVTKLLKQLQKVDYDTDITGFAERQLVQFLAAAKKQMDEVKITSRFEVVVECKNEKEQQQVYEQLIDEGRTVRLLTT